MRLPFALRSLLAAWLCLDPAVAKDSISPPKEDFTKLSGAELVQRLLDEKTQLKAYYELSLRNSSNEGYNFEAFRIFRSNATVVACPQENGQPPLYIVLSECFSVRSRDGYKLEQPTEIFPPRIHTARDEERLTEVFNSEGKAIDPFNGNRNLKGTLRDINRDGLVEVVEAAGWDINGVGYVSTIQISAVKAVAQPLLTVLLNWGDAEWAHRLTDSDSDGIFDLEIGPFTKEGFKPKAVWKWDASRKTYIGPDGKDGDHFRVLSGKATREELNALKKAGLVFPKDREAIDESAELRMETRIAAPSTQAPAAPYQFKSLKDADDAELLHFMKSRKQVRISGSREGLPNTLPKDFWQLSGKAGALALLQANRNTAHRQTFDVAIDDRQWASPPERCSIDFSSASSRCYNAVDWYYFLVVAPEGSYLAYGRSWSGGVVFFNAVHDQPAFDLRLLPLAYADARRISDMLWWLDRARTRNNSNSYGSSSTMSTADGSGTLIFRPDQGAAFERSGTLWAGSIPDRWDVDYNPETMLNFARFLFSNALPERLGKAWSDLEPKASHDVLGRGPTRPQYEKAELQRMGPLSLKFLQSYSPDKNRISPDLAALAASFAGKFSMDAAKGAAARGDCEPSSERSKATDI